MDAYNHLLSAVGRLVAALLLLFNLLSALAPAQAQDWLWAQRGGGGSFTDGGSGVAVDAAGNAYVTGYFYDTATFGDFTLTSAGLEDVFVVKYTPGGEVLWARRGGGTSLDRGFGVAVDAAGNAYVTGYFYDTATFGPFTLTSAGENDIFVVKYASDGEVLWARRGGGTSLDRGFGVAVDAAGNAYVTGQFFGTATGVQNVFLVKYTPEGEVLWARRGGGSSSESGSGVAVDAAANAYVTGYFDGTATFGTFTLTSAGALDAFLVKYAPDGEVLWARSGGGTGSDFGNGVAADGNAYVTGYFQDTATFGPFTLTSAGFNDVFLVKYAPGGEVLWAQSGGGSSSESGSGVAVDAAGNAYVTGRFRDTATFGDFTLTSAGFDDVFLVKYAPGGEVLWATSGGGSSSDFGNGVAADVAGNAYVTGFFEGTATFGDHTLTSAGFNDVFVAKHGAEAAVTVAAVPLNSPVPRGDTLRVGVTLTNLTPDPLVVDLHLGAAGPGGHALSGSLATGLALAPGGTLDEAFPFHIEAQAPLGAYAAIVTALVGGDGLATAAFPFEVVSGVATEPGAGPVALVLSEARPNPSRDRAQLVLVVSEAQHVTAAVYDGLGRRVAVLLDGTVEAGQHALVFDGSPLPAGVYLVRVTGERFAATRRLVLLR